MSCDYCSLPPNRCECISRDERALRYFNRLDGPPERKLVEPVIPDHMHWYRVMGAVYLRWQACETWESVPRYL